MATAPRPVALRTAAACVALPLGANLAWEAAHVRLYAIRTEATPAEVARAVLHCTVGDAALGVGAPGAALVLTGARGWPVEQFGRVALAATLLGLAATVIIAWIVLAVRERWAYALAMLRLPPDLTPVLQWAILPPLLLSAARRLAAAPRRTAGGLS